MKNYYESNKEFIDVQKETLLHSFGAISLRKDCKK